MEGACRVNQSLGKMHTVRERRGKKGEVSTKEEGGEHKRRERCAQKKREVSTKEGEHKRREVSTKEERGEHKRR